MARETLGYTGLPRVPINEFATTPNPGVVGVLIDSSTVGKVLKWDGTQWTPIQYFLAATAPPAIAAASAVGVSQNVAKQDHTHAGVTSISVNGGAAQQGAVALSIPTIQVARLTATQASTAVALANVTQLVAAMVANGVYRVTCFATFQSAAATTGLNLGFTVPTGATPMTNIYVPIASTAGATGIQQTSPAAAGTTAYNALGTAVTAINSNHTASIDGIVVCGATAGNFQVQFATEVAASGVTLQIGSTLVLERLA